MMQSQIIKISLRYVFRRTYLSFLSIAALQIFSTMVPRYAKADDLKQDVCAKLSPVPGPLGYQPRDNGKWCEGEYNPRVSASTIELLDFRVQSTAFASTPPTLTISHTDPIAYEGRSLHVIMVSLGPATYYRLDAVLNSQDDLISIPTKTVIAPAGIGINSLGVTGYIGQEVMPLVVSDDTHQAPGKVASTLSVTLRTGFISDQIQWRFEGSCATTDTWTRVGGPFFAPRTPIRFSIPTPPAGECSLGVSAHEPRWLA